MTCVKGLIRSAECSTFAWPVVSSSSKDDRFPPPKAFTKKQLRVLRELEEKGLDNPRVRIPSSIPNSFARRFERAMRKSAKEGPEASGEKGDGKDSPGRG